jgi:hypothetical protein
MGLGSTLGVGFLGVAEVFFLTDDDFLAGFFASGVFLYPT